MSYRPFGLYRLILATLVIFQHINAVAWEGFYVPMVGTLAVMAFFVLSGFILAEAAAHHYIRRPVAFAANRALRIVPLYWLALGTSMAVHYIGHANGAEFAADPLFARSFAEMFSFENIAKNVFAFTFSPLASYMFVPYIWAVRIEFVFYLLLGLGIAASIIANAKTVRIGATVSGLALSGVFLIAGAPKMLMFVPFFGLGMLAYLAMRDRTPLLILGSLLLFIATLSSAVLFVLPEASPQPMAPADLAMHAGLLAGLLIIVPVLAHKNIQGKLRRADRIAGALSYPVYLQQYAVIVAVHLTMPRGVLAILVTFVAVFVVAWLSERLVERAIAPFRDLIRGRSLGDKSEPAISATGIQMS